MNYTEEQTQYLITMYTSNPHRDSVTLLAKELDRSEKSIIGKLSKEGVYQKKVYTTKTGETPITKVALVSMIEDLVGGETILLGLEKAPKHTLQILHNCLKSLV